MPKADTVPAIFELMSPKSALPQNFTLLWKSIFPARKILLPTPDERMTIHQWPFANNLNQRAEDLCQQTLLNGQLYGVLCSHVAKANLLDFAVGRPGTIAGGIRLAEICMSGLAEVKIHHGCDTELGLPLVQVITDHPVEACIASQYAGWAFSAGDYFAMCSGPARMLRFEEAILSRYGLTADSKTCRRNFRSQRNSLGRRNPTLRSPLAMSRRRVSRSALRHTASLPGTIQVVSRSVETTLHKLHELGFDLTSVKNAIGSAPLPPIAADDLTALGWTNDSILYGSRVNLWVESEDAAIEEIVSRLPSSSSEDFGVPFLDIFQSLRPRFLQNRQTAVQPRERSHPKYKNRSHIFLRPTAS